MAISLVLGLPLIRILPSSFFSPPGLLSLLHSTSQGSFSPGLKDFHTSAMISYIYSSFSWGYYFLIWSRFFVRNKWQGDAGRVGGLEVGGLRGDVLERGEEVVGGFLVGCCWEGCVGGGLVVECWIVKGFVFSYPTFFVMGIFLVLSFIMCPLTICAPKCPFTICPPIFPPICPFIPPIPIVTGVICASYIFPNCVGGQKASCPKPEDCMYPIDPNSPQGEYEGTPVSSSRYFPHMYLMCRKVDYSLVVTYMMSRISFMSIVGSQGRVEEWFDKGIYYYRWQVGVIDIREMEEKRVVKRKGEQVFLYGQPWAINGCNWAQFSKKGSKLEKNNFGVFFNQSLATWSLTKILGVSSVCRFPFGTKKFLKIDFFLMIKLQKDYETKYLVDLQK